MQSEFAALYYASLYTKCHSAIYRLPGEGKIHFDISKNLEDFMDQQEGFLIAPFNNLENSKVIVPEAKFIINENGSIDMLSENSFTWSINNSIINKTRESTSLNSPYFFPKNIHSASMNNYIDTVNIAKALIREGEFQKTVLTRSFKYLFKRKTDPSEIFISLCDRYPEAFVNLISSPEFGTWIGATPEILIKQNGNNYSTMALAGTKIISKKNDFRIKEIEEQKIIVDYITDFLKVRNLQYHILNQEKFKSGDLVHLCTSINFKAPPEWRFEIARELHPTPAVGGFPKQEGLKFLYKMENYPREIYSGYLGFFDKQNMDLFVNIRCMQWFPEYAMIYAGAGITLDSDPLSEWEETENKIKVISKVLEPNV